MRTPAISVLVVAFIIISAFNFPHSSTVPEYVKGEDAMYKTLANNLTYPLEARKQNRSGIVYVTFEVTPDGKVGAIRYDKSGDHILKEMVIVGYLKEVVSPPADPNEAMSDAVADAIQKLEGFKPAVANGETVTSTLTLPVKSLLNN